MSKNKIIDIDAEFENFVIDEADIIRATGLVKREQNGWFFANELKNKDPNIREKLSRAQLDSWNDPIKSKARLNGQHEYWNKEQSKIKAREKHTGKKFMDAITKRSSDPEFGKKISKGKYKPIKVPWGEYQSVGDAMREGKKLGIANVTRVLPRGLKEDPDNFYFIKNPK